MAKTTVKRKRLIKSYAGFATGAAKYTIEPLTKDAHQYALEFLRKRTKRKTGNLEDNLIWNIRGTTGMVKVSGSGKQGAGNHAHLIEYGTGPRSHDSGKSVGEMAARPFMRPGVAKAMRNLRRLWREGLKEAEREQRA